MVICDVQIFMFFFKHNWMHIEGSSDEIIIILYNFHILIYIFGELGISFCSPIGESLALLSKRFTKEISVVGKLFKF